MQDFVQVACAYISMYDHGNVPANLLEKFEKVIEVNALNIDVHQAITLAQAFATCGSSYTMEVFDRIIGSQIDDINVHQVYDAFMAFTRVQQATVRPKITSLLLRCLSEQLDKLLPIQLLNLSQTLLSSGSENADAS